MSGKEIGCWRRTKRRVLIDTMATIASATFLPLDDLLEYDFRVGIVGFHFFVFFFAFQCPSGVLGGAKRHA